MPPLGDPDALEKCKTPEKFGLINQHGTSRKVRPYLSYSPSPSDPQYPKHIFDAVKGSLERLQVDYIDVLHCEP